jgi:hypothetical protein
MLFAFQVAFAICEVIAKAQKTSAHSATKVRVMVAALPPANSELKKAGPPLVRIAAKIAKLPEPKSASLPACPHIM